jgi:integrase
LKWSDIDLENGIIHIRRTLKEERTYNEAGFSKSKLATDDPKTIASARKLGISLIVDAAIFRHRQFVLKAAELAGDRWVESDWLIPSAHGGPWNPNNASRQFKTFCKNNSIRVIRVHDMRHTAATDGLGNGARLEAVSQALGHSRIETTKSVYAPYVQPLIDEFTTMMDDAHSGTLLVQLDNELSEWGRENGSPFY